MLVPLHYLTSRYAHHRGTGQRTGSLLTIARDERHRRTTIEQSHGGFDLRAWRHPFIGRLRRSSAFVSSMVVQPLILQPPEGRSARREMIQCAICSGGGKDVFVHISAVEKAGLSSLNEGQIVEYEEVPNKGKTSAENLKVQR
jgi:cold shock CspA family protein